MSRPARSTSVLALAALVAISAAVSACGTEHIGVPASSPLHEGAVLFSQRCAGCHTFSYAATHGSAANVRSAQPINGPNFDVRCERPVWRVLYAIENGGFSGAYMPQNVVVGKDAMAVAEFVATYSGRHSPLVPGTAPCSASSIQGTPPFVAAAVGTASQATTPTSTTTTAAGGTGKPAKRKHAKK